MTKTCKACGRDFEAVGKTLNCSKECSRESNLRRGREWHYQHYIHKIRPRRASGCDYENTAERLDELRTKYSTTAIDEIVDEWMDELFRREKNKEE